MIGATLRQFVQAGIEREDAARIADLRDQALHAVRRARARCPRSTPPTPRTRCATRLEASACRTPWRLAEPLAAAGRRRRRGSSRCTRSRDRRTRGRARIGRGVARRPAARERAAGVDRAHELAGRRGQGLRLHGSRRASSRPTSTRGSRRRSRSWATSSSTPRSRSARLRPHAAAPDHLRLRAQPGVDQPARQRDRRARRARHDHDHDHARRRVHPWSTSRTPDRASRPRSARGCSSRSSPPRTSGTARASGWTPPGGSSIERHGGSITFDTAEQGTTFHVWLRLHPSSPVRMEKHR